MTYGGRVYNKRETGARYERLAGRYLESLGYRILLYNYRCRLGEIDIVAEDGEYLVFCEVKYRSGDAAGAPGEAVDRRKQRRISRCAAYYLMEHGQADIPCRFDVVCIAGDRADVIKDAFDYTG